jgi:hypothetical protein
MPQVDFTLEDVRTLIRSEIGPLRADIGTLQQEFRGFRVEFDEFQRSVADSFQDLAEDMNMQFDEVRGELKAIRRVTRQHSADIAELRAGQGRL